MSENRTTYINPNAIKDNSIPTSKISGLSEIAGAIPYTWNENSDMNNMVAPGIYEISGMKLNENDHLPIYNGGNVSGRLFVMENDNCISQTLILLNVGGGDNNIYTRIRQNGIWEPYWGKLQSNMEVGAIGFSTDKSFDDFTDNGMYSGVNLYWVNENNVYSAETFVLIVINGYLYGGGITQLKYSIMADGTVNVQTRKRMGENPWTEWDNIASKNEPLPSTSSEIKEIIYSGQSSFNLTLEPNVYYKIQGVDSLYIEFKEGKSGILNNYMFEVSFDGSSFINLPDTIKWANGKSPIDSLSTSSTLQVSVINNLGTYTIFY